MRITAQIRIRRQGAIVYQEAATFSSMAKAKAWAKRRESDIEDRGVESLRDPVTVAEVLDRYVKEVEQTPGGIGRTKKSTILAMAQRAPWSRVKLAELSSSDIVGYLQERARDGAAPSTVDQDLTYLRVVTDYARVAWSMPVDMGMFEDVQKLVSRLGVTGRSDKRDVRPTLEQLDRILAYYSRKRKRRATPSNVQQIPMRDLVLFQIFSTRRLDETCRILRADLDEEHQRVLVRDMKHPRQKKGNNVWVHLPDRAWALIQQQLARLPADEPRIWPYESRSVSRSWDRARAWAYGEDAPDLTLHDLRHEGVSHLFELGWDIPRVAMVSGHRSWDNLKRYTHLIRPQAFDKYAGWEALPKNMVA